jgi:hypothetical protein
MGQGERVWRGRSTERSLQLPQRSEGEKEHDDGSWRGVLSMKMNEPFKEFVVKKRSRSTTA